LVVGAQVTRTTFGAVERRGSSRVTTLGLASSTDLALGGLTIIMGLSVILGSAQLAAWAQKSNPPALVRGTSLRAYRVGFRVVGATFIAFGALACLGIIHFR